jgi:enoyl-CoA hydratase/carnithine racemase
MTNHIIIEEKDGILQLILNRPDKKNALSNAMYETLCEQLIRAQETPQINVVLIRSANADFTSGNDLKDFAAVNQGSADLSNLPVLRLLRLVVGFNKPLVAAVKGLAVGIGTTLLLHCDLVIAGQSATFQLPFVPLGLVPEFASSYLLPQLAGKARANVALMLGEAFDANTANLMGLISHLVADEAVDAKALKICHKLCMLPPQALRNTKALITPKEMQMHLLKVIEHELQIFGQQLQSAEHREALSAFFEKRAPNFRNLKRD